MVYTSWQKALFIFQLLGERHCWWTSKSPRAHVAKFYGRLRLIRSVLRASKFPVSKLIEIVILWVYYTIPFGFSLFLGHHFPTFETNPFWLRITDEGSVPEMRIWSILLINSDLKWCIHLGRSLFLYSKLRKIKRKDKEIKKLILRKMFIASRELTIPDSRGQCANHCAMEDLKLECAFVLIIDSRYL